jgi:hypothetical protein
MMTVILNAMDYAINGTFLSMSCQETEKDKTSNVANIANPSQKCIMTDNSLSLQLKGGITKLRETSENNKQGGGKLSLRICTVQRRTAGIILPVQCLMRNAFAAKKMERFQKEIIVNIYMISDWSRLLRFNH